MKKLCNRSSAMLEGAVLVAVLTVLVSSAFAQQDGDLFKKARKLSQEQEWLKAVDVYQQLIDTFPSSQYADDAKYWSAFCLERSGTNSVAAFLTFQELVGDFPRSSWSDEAQVHQIHLAQSFVLSGKIAHLDFLRDKLSSSNEDIRRQAALALGRLGDEQARPHLDEIAENNLDSAPEAKELLGLLDELAGASQNEQLDRARSRLEIVTETQPEELVMLEGEKGFFEKLFIKSRRYKRFEKLWRKGMRWTASELADYGLWHITPEDQFDEY